MTSLAAAINPSRVLAALLATALFSLSAVSARRTTRYVSGTEANFTRLIIAVLMLTLLAYTLGKGFAPYFHRDFLGLWLLSGAIGFGMGDVALFQALPLLGSRLTTLVVHCVAATLAATLEWLWLGNAMSLPQILCSLVILCGLGIALAPEKDVATHRGHLSKGIGWALIAAVGQGVGAALLSRYIYNKAAMAGTPIEGIEGGLAVACQRMLGGIAFTGLLLCVLKWWRPANAADAKPAQWKAAAPWLVLNGLCGPALGVSCYQWALSNHGTGVVMPIVAATPIIVIPFAVLMKEETPTWRSLLGGAVAVAGVVGMALSNGAK
ncbi:MAG: DMT family transporter [Pedosphaera sp.]|nr:DMT family transporter [Pedosphaera sp.]